MRIAVDARELAGRPTGVGRYLAELLASWSRDERARGTHITLFAPQAIGLPVELGDTGARIDTAIASGGSGTRWEQLTLPRAIGRDVDVLFCPGYSAPLLTRVPFVVAIHDVSFFAHPEWFGSKEGLRRRWTVKAAARRAARVLTISDFSRGEIVRHLGVPAERVEVTWLAPWRGSSPQVPSPHHSPRLRQGDAGLVEAVAEAARPRAERTGARSVLCVGTILNRRQIPLLVRGFAPIARQDPQARLVIVGENRTFPAEDPAAIARAFGIAAAVDLRSYVSDEILAQLYREASAFAWLSTYEGFGLTPLEAMAAGVPVVACDTPVAREVYGDAARLVPAGDVDGVTRALTAVLDDEAVRDELREAAAGTLARFSWDETARATLDVLRRAARR
jgi:glycosyltransferase involved in cell wall biosynthesis